MEEISDLLRNQIDSIIEQWKEKVRQDRKIGNSQHLSDTALSDSLPEVLQGLASALSEIKEEEEEEELNFLAKSSLAHGTHRAKKGYNAGEIAREYRLLRQVIFDYLEPHLIQLSVSEYHRVNRLINLVFDEAVSQCFHHFVEERNQAEEKLKGELSLNNKELQRLLNLSRENFSSLAHELKTPLNSIMGYSQLLLRDIQGKKVEESVSADRVDRVLHSSRLLLQLVNEALEASRYESGNTSLKIVSVDVCRVINSVVQTIEPLAISQDLDLRVNCELTTKVRTDPTRLQQILTNLISNAVRYTDTGYVDIICKELPENQWLVSIKDTGIGIPEEDQSKIFDPFFRASSHRSGSTGLGLTIAGRLVKLLQGEIQLESRVGQGSTFTAIFPIEVKDKNLCDLSDGDGG